MAGSGRRFALAGILMPLLFLAMAGLSHATVFTVTSLSGEPVAPAACGLVDAIAAANGTNNVCGTTSGTDTIVFALTGTIVVDEPLVVTDTGKLTIQGRLDSPVIIDGDGVTQIIDHEDGDLTLNNLTFQNGVADSMFGIVGGAILANSAGDLDINGCTFHNNFAVVGGAIFGGGGTVTILNSTFANNTADTGSTGGGGAIFNNGSTLDIAFSTFWMNTAPEDAGGALGWQGGFPPTVKNSIFVSTPAGDSDNCQAPGNVPDTTLVDNGFNISDDETCFTGFTTSLISKPLMLDPTGLQNNGGPTQTVLPAGTSPAVDFVPGTCEDNSSNPVMSDQRLFDRPDLSGGLPESFCDAGAVETGSLAPITIVPKSLRLQIARSTTPNTDLVNTAFTFAYNGDPSCEITPGGDEDALNAGFYLSLYNSTCAALPANGLMLSLNPFVVHTVNHQQYGTLFQMSPPNMLQQSKETVSARMVSLKPLPGACGTWTLNLQVAGLNTLDTSTVNLPGTAAAPWALVITDWLKDASVCFDISNAIVGNQIPTPGHGVRRGTRR
jgi:hypothetical protein